jgi:hypothetical protein
VAPGKLLADRRVQAVVRRVHRGDQEGLKLSDLLPVASLRSFRL